MLVPDAFQSPISVQAIRMHYTARLDGMLDELVQVRFCRGSHASQANSPDASSILLCGNHHERFSYGLPSVNVFFLTSDKRFIDLDASLQTVPARTHHCATQFVQPCPSRQIATQAQRTLHTDRTGPVLLTRDVPHGPKPHSQRLARILKNRPRRHRCLITASVANEPASRGRPAALMMAARTNEPVRPPQPNQVVPTGFLRRKPVFQLQDRPGIVFHTPYTICGGWWSQLND